MRSDKVYICKLLKHSNALCYDYLVVVQCASLMQYRLYRAQHAEPSSCLILFFNGWAMTPESVEHLVIPPGFDLLVVWDYRVLDLPKQELQGYEQIYLFAWSMGVWAADRLASLLNIYPIQLATAVCGTGYLVHDRYGIPIAVFKSMIDGISDSNRERFNRRMCGGRMYPHLLAALAQRATNEIRNELLSVYEIEYAYAYMMELERSCLSWSCALVGGKDRVIPSTNQSEYWNKRGVNQKVYPEGEHYLFAQFGAWSQLIDIALE